MDAANQTLTAIAGVTVGHHTDLANLTGVTVIRFADPGAIAGVSVMGSAPGTRETDLLDPSNLVDTVNAIVLTGGSAFGLAAATGVVSVLEESGSGLSVAQGQVVPIVPAAVIFDLGVGNPKVRPDADAGDRAARSASDEPVEMGNVGAGTGATVGKLKGAARSTKGGLGSSLISLPGGKLVGCLVVVNPVGEIRDPSSGSILAGIRGDNRGEFLSSVEAITGGLSSKVLPGTNTTIATIVTNVSMTKTQLTKVAQMAHDGMARTINPVHTQFDGDTVFAASTKTSSIESDLSPADTVNQIGTAAAEALSKAIILAANHAETIDNIPSGNEWRSK
jgi:L-aminopeptidase/D-esterase-like protein